MRAWYRARRKAHVKRRAWWSRRSPGGAGVGGDDWGDVLGEAIGGLIEALFKIFD